jgi:hypothetical protein
MVPPPFERSPPPQRVMVGAPVAGVSGFPHFEARAPPQPENVRTNCSRNATAAKYLAAGVSAGKGSRQAGRYCSSL